MSLQVLRSLVLSATLAERVLRVVFGATLLCLSVQSGAATTVSQTLTFPTMQAWPVSTSGTFLSSGWGQPFPFTNPTQIQSISFEVSSADPKFNDPHFWAVDANNYQGVSFIVLDTPFAEGTFFPVAAGGILSGPIAFPGTQLFNDYASLLASTHGMMTIKLGGGTNFNPPGYSDGLTYDQPTTATLTIVGNPIPEPETYAMLLAGLGLLGFAARRRKQQTA